MRIAYLECFSGISGDMFLGALIDAGVPFELLQKTVADLGVGATLELSRVNRGGISAAKVDVLVNGKKDLPREEFWSRNSASHPSRDVLPDPHAPSPSVFRAEDGALFKHDHSHEDGLLATGSHRHEHTHSHSHEHSHEDGTRHSHEHNHSHTHSHDHAKPHKHERGDLNSHAHHAERAQGSEATHHHEHHDRARHLSGQDHSLEHQQHNHGGKLSDILGLIAATGISAHAKRTASEIFLALGAAEAKVHNVGVEDIHFHEVGAADAIVDIVCAAVGAEALAVKQFISSPLNVGGGTVTCAHGVLPVPAPATLELLQGVPTFSGDIQKELVTPTGAAITKVLVSSFEAQPAMVVERSGYGAGTRDFPGHANVLRLTIGELKSAHADPGPAGRAYAEEEIAVLETNVDDMNPQLIGYLMEAALAAGALDVFTTPVQMKKNRPGTLLTMLAKLQDEQKLLGLLFRESSSLGVRTRREKRYVLARRHETVVTPWGEVRMKIGSVDGTISQFAPEYEDCRRIAVEHRIPLKTVMQEAMRLYLDYKNG